MGEGSGATWQRGKGYKKKNEEKLKVSAEEESVRVCYKEWFAQEIGEAVKYHDERVGFGLRQFESRSKGRRGDGSQIPRKYPKQITFVVNQKGEPVIYVDDRNRAHTVRGQSVVFPDDVMEATGTATFEDAIDVLGDIERRRQGIKW